MNSSPELFSKQLQAVCACVEAYSESSRSNQKWSVKSVSRRMQFGERRPLLSRRHHFPSHILIVLHTRNHISSRYKMIILIIYSSIIIIYVKRQRVMGRIGSGRKKGLRYSVTFLYISSSNSARVVRMKYWGQLKSIVS